MSYMNECLTLYIHLHFVVHDVRICESAEFSQRACALNKSLAFQQ